MISYLFVELLVSLKTLKRLLQRYQKAVCILNTHSFVGVYIMISRLNIPNQKQYSRLCFADQRICLRLTVCAFFVV